MAVRPACHRSLAGGQLDGDEIARAGLHHHPQLPAGGLTWAPAAGGGQGKGWGGLRAAGRRIGCPRHVDAWTGLKSLARAALGMRIPQGQVAGPACTCILHDKLGAQARRGTSFSCLAPSDWSPSATMQTASMIRSTFGVAKPAVRVSAWAGQPWGPPAPFSRPGPPPIGAHPALRARHRKQAAQLSSWPLPPPPPSPLLQGSKQVTRASVEFYGPGEPPL